MDIESELETLKRPALVGASLRDSSVSLATAEVSPARPIIKNSHSQANVVTLEDLKAEGGLIDGQEGPIDAILDAEGHLKAEALPDTGLEVKQALPAVQSGIDEQDESHINVFGGDGDQFVVPASGKASKYKRQVKRGSHSNLLDESTSEIITPERVMSVDDIIDEVNSGAINNKKSSKTQKKLDSMMKQLDELDFNLGEESEHIDDLDIHQDAGFIAPASRRDGSVSATATPVRGRSSERSGVGMFKPHLARGDSYHSGLNSSDDVSHFQPSTTSERVPRHDPNAPKITNSSSLNYLRTISRSRSRAANDRKALGEDISLDELKNSGGLVNDDQLDGNMDTSNYDGALKKAMEFVDNSHHIKSVRSSVSVLDNVEEGKEEPQDASSRAKIEVTSDNNDDLLEKLANSAKELMFSGDEEEAEKEEEEEEKEQKEEKQEKDKPEEDSDESANQLPSDSIIAEESESAISDSANILAGEPAADDVVSEMKDKTIDSVESGNSVIEKATIEVEEKAAETTPVVPGETEVAEGKEQVESTQPSVEANVPLELKLDETTASEPIADQDEVQNKVNDDVEAEAAGEENDNHSMYESSTNDEPELPLQLSGNKEEEQTDDTVSPSEETTEAAEAEAEIESEDEEALLEAALKEMQIKGRSFDKGDELEVFVAGALKEEKDKKDHEEFDAIVAGVKRERALAENHASDMGQDGSIYVPKANGKMTFEDEPVYLYTSLAGGFQVHNRTQRVITILTVNKIKFTVRDLGTDEEAKSIWKRYCGGKTLPGIVRGKDDFIGNWQDIEEANENYAIKSLIYESF